MLDKLKTMIMTDQLPKQVLSFNGFFRLIFVFFSLYLMGDAFSSWDGFSYYASFLEFIPSVALAFILWSIVAAVTAAMLWLSFKLIEWAGNLIGLEIGTQHLLLNAFLFALIGGSIWKIKQMGWSDVQTTLVFKLAVLGCAFFLSIYLTWLFRNKAGRFAVIAQERLTPLVWLYGIILVLSVPLVSYHAWIKGTGSEILERTTGNFGIKDYHPNIILVSFDALAAREMSLYGYNRNTTPFITEWSKNATVFTRAESGSNFTTPAVAGLMTGKRVWTHQTYHIAGTKPVRSAVESLPSLLKDYGYFNIALVTNPFASVRMLGMENSFDIAPLTSEFGVPASLFGWKFGVVDEMLYRAFGDKIRLHNWIFKNDFILSRVINLFSRNISETTVPPAKTFDRFLEIIDGRPQKPFFAWIHLFPPHDPYLPPEQYKGEYNSSRELRTYKSQEKLIEDSYTHLFNYLPFPEEMQPSVNLMRDYYDEFVTYIDSTFEDFTEGLNKKNPGNTIIILTADHGESFEHGYFTHGGPFLYEQVTHVPLIIKMPDQKKGQTLASLIEQVDIPATILGLAGIPVPSWMEGRSLVPLMQGEKLPGRPAFSMNFEGNPSMGRDITSGSIAVWDGDYKLIHYLDKNESLLFNIKQDPDELLDITHKEPEISQHLLDVILGNLEQANEKIDAGR